MLLKVSQLDRVSDCISLFVVDIIKILVMCAADKVFPLRWFKFYKYDYNLF